MINPRTKGAGGELEAARVLTGMARRAGFTLYLERNLEQVRAGGADLNGVPGLEIEVKRQENLSIGPWWAQVCRACDTSGKRPVLMFRQNRKPWTFKFRPWVAVYSPGGVGTTVAMDVIVEADMFERWFAEHLRHHMPL